MVPGNVDVANHRDWVEKRRVFRKELDNMGNLPKLFNSELTGKEIVKLVVEREKMTSAPPKSGAGGHVTRPSRLDPGPSPKTMLPGNVDVANHRDWVEKRRVFRKELDNMGNLPKLFHSEPTGKEIVKLVVEREKMTSAPPKSGAGGLVTRPSHLDFDSEQQQRDQRSLPEIRERCPQQLSIIKPELTLSMPSLSEEEKACILQHRRARGMGDMHDEERLAISKLLCPNSSREDDHLQPSTLGGSAGLDKDRFRRQILGEHRDTLDRCRKKGVAISQSTLEKGLLHPRERDRASLILKPKKIIEEQEEEPPKLITAYLPKKSVRPKPKMMNLSTGRAKIVHKTDCWMTSEEYKGLSGTVTMMPADQCANRKAFWPGKEDRVRLHLPKVCLPAERMVFQHRQRAPAVSRGNWPINSHGYYTSGNIDKLKTYIL